MLVRIIKDWEGDIFRQIPARGKVWEGVEFTTDSIRTCDVLLVLNVPTKNEFVHVSKGGKWIFSQESPVDIYQWHTKAYKHFDKVFGFWENNSEKIIHTQTALSWLIGKSYDELIKMSAFEAVEAKKSEISWVTSNAKEKPGHLLRLNLKSFLEKKGLKFDLYGRGFEPIEDKFDGIYPYKYSLAIENYSCNDYWTEKIIDCFLSWTVPIYYGASNITDYFPKESMILIDPNKPEEALEIINRAMDDNFFEKSLPYIEESRELILNKYQIFPWVVKLIRESDIDFNRKKWSFIPKNTNPEYTIAKKISRLFI